MDSRHQRNICQIIHKFKKKYKIFTKIRNVVPRCRHRRQHRGRRSIRPRLLRDMVLSHLLLLLLLRRLRQHTLLQLLYHHRRRGRGGEADARAVPRAAHVLWRLRVHPETRQNVIDQIQRSKGGGGVSQAIDRAAALGPESHPTLKNSVDGGK